jgi:photosystem II reaction center protein PsbM
MDLEIFIHLCEIKSRDIFERSKDQEIMELNTLAFIVVLLFLSISTSFLFIPYVKTTSANSGNT